MKITVTLFLFAMVVSEIAMKEVLVDDSDINPKLIESEEVAIDYDSKDFDYPTEIKVLKQPRVPDTPKNPAPPKNSGLNKLVSFVLNLVFQAVSDIRKSTQTLKKFNDEMVPNNSRRAAALQDMDVAKLSPAEKTLYRRDLLSFVRGNPTLEKIVEAILGKGSLPRGVPKNDAIMWVFETIKFGQNFRSILNKDLSSLPASIRGIAVGELYPRDTEAKKKVEETVRLSDQ